MDWRIVSKFPKYEINSQGEIRLRDERRRKLQVTEKGTVSLIPKGGGRRMLANVHRLAAEAFPS